MPVKLSKITLLFFTDKEWRILRLVNTQIIISKQNCAEKCRNINTLDHNWTMIITALIGLLIATITKAMSCIFKESLVPQTIRRDTSLMPWLEAAQISLLFLLVVVQIVNLIQNHDLSQNMSCQKWSLILVFQWPPITMVCMQLRLRTSAVFRKQA